MHRLNGIRSAASKRVATVIENMCARAHLEQNIMKFIIINAVYFSSLFSTTSANAHELCRACVSVCLYESKLMTTFCVCAFACAFMCLKINMETNIKRSWCDPETFRWRIKGEKRNKNTNYIRDTSSRANSKRPIKMRYWFKMKQFVRLSIFTRNLIDNDHIRTSLTETAVYIKL